MLHILSEEETAARSAALGRRLSAKEIRLLAAYLEVLVKWNRRVNLVGPASGAEILETLVQDSWLLADLLHTLDPQPEIILDLGAGAGLPGIPLRIVWNSGHYFLVEPRQKRAIFMSQALAALRLPNTFVLNMRMEELPPASRTAELIVSRAFRPWRELLASARDYLAPDGRLLVMASTPRPDTEAPGYVLERTQEYTVAGKSRAFWLFVRRS